MMKGRVPIFLKREFMNLNQVAVSVQNIENSTGFYQKLGLRLIVKSPHYARFECPDGESTFSIEQSDAPKGSVGVSIYFEIADLDAKVAELLEKGLVFDELPEDKSWLWREARLRDLDGNLLVLFSAGSNRKFPPWRLND